MSQGKPTTKTATLYVCRFCGKVGVRTLPTSSDLGGCVQPNSAHNFETVEVVIRPKA
jgi:hypothetical protein